MIPQLKLALAVVFARPSKLDQFKLYPEYNATWEQERRKLKARKEAHGRNQ